MGGFGGSQRIWNPYEFQLNTGNVANLDLAWTATPVTGPTEGLHQAVVASGRAFFATAAAGNVYALSLSTHAVSWHANVDARSSTPAALGSTLYVGNAGFSSFAGKLEALSQSTGALKWEHDFGGGDVVGTPTIAGGVVYVQVSGSSDSGLYAFPTSCSNPCAPIWHGVTAGGTAAPAIGGGIVVVTTSDDSVTAFDVGCGTGGATCGSRWSTDLGTAVPSSAAISARVYVSNSDGHLSALSLTTGTVLWTDSTGDTFTLHSPAVTGGIAYAGSNDGSGWAVPRSCGTSDRTP